MPGATTYYLEATASAKVKAGPYELKWGKVKNPRTTAPSGIFKIMTKDANNYIVAEGSINTIIMTTPGIFSKFTVKPSDLKVGATNDYTVELTSSVPIFDGDYLIIGFPESIGTPDSEAVGGFCVPVTKP
jgi:hypothetical protein